MLLIARIDRLERLQSSLIPQPPQAFDPPSSNPTCTNNFSIPISSASSTLVPSPESSPWSQAADAAAENSEMDVDSDKGGDQTGDESDSNLNETATVTSPGVVHNW